MATNLKKKLQEEGRLKEARNLINKQARDYGNTESYGRGNINLNNRPVVQNDDGTISTVRSMSFYDENEGKEILVPTVVNGKIVSDDEAIKHYYNTGEYLGKFDTVKQANSYANYLHTSQENMYSKVTQRANQLIQEYDKSKMLDTNEFFYNYDKQKLKEENQKSLEGLNDGTLGGYMSMGLVSTLNKLKSLGQKPKDFYDGKDITDIPKVIGSTLLGIPTHIIGGIEGIGNTGTQAFGYGMSAINDIVGNKETAERWKRATQEQQKEHDEVKNKIYGLFDKSSLLGETSNEVAEGVGQSTALGVVGSKSKLAGNLLTFQQGFGNSLHDTYTKEDAEGWQALLRGVGSGAISTLTENIFELQGFGGSGIDDAIKNKVTRQIESGIGKALARTAISAGGEGTEEVLEALGNTGLNYIMNRITEQVGHGAKFDENINVEELFENATVGFLNGLLGEGGSTYLQTNASSNAIINQIEQDTNSKLTKEEKKAIKQETLLNSETQRENEHIIDKSNLTDSQKEHLKTFAQNNYLTNKDVQQAIEMATKHNEQFTTQDYDFNRNIEIDTDNLNEVKNQNEDTLKKQIHSILEGETTITDLINNNEKITDEQKQELMDLTKDENNNLIDVLNQLNDYENTNNIPSNDTTMQNEAIFDDTQQVYQEVDKKPNIIHKKVNDYIRNLGRNFNSNIELNTKEVDNEIQLPIDYNNAKEGTLKRIAKDLFKKINKNVFENNGENIYVTNSDINESIGNTVRKNEQRQYMKQNLSVFSQLDKIIENAIEISSSETDNKNRGQYKDYKYYVSNVYIDGKPYVVEFDTRVQKGNTGQDERHFVLERVYEINKEGDSVIGTDSKSINQLSRESPSSNSILPQSEKTVKVDINNNKLYNKDSYKPKQTKMQSITVAPYYNTKLTDENFEEIKNNVDEHYRNTVDSITNMFGGKVKNVTTNIGGYTFTEGENAGQMVNELSYTFDLQDVDEKTADLIASVIGDLAYEQQEAVIASNYEKINSKTANVLETRVKFNNIEGVKEALDRAGIQDYTIDTTNNLVKILDFEGNMSDTIAQFEEELGGNFNGAEWTKSNSRYYDTEARRGLYEAWLTETDRNGERGELYNYITEAKQKVEERIKENENSQNEGSFSMQQDEEVFREETNKLLNNEPPKTKPRQFPLSVQESDYVSDEVKKENSRKILKTETGQYTPIGNQETIDKANEKIQNSGADNVYTSFNTKFENNEKITLNDIAEAELLIQHYSEIGDTEKAVKLIENVGILGTELGQQVQALSIIKKMTPQGQLAVANKLAERLSKKYDTDIEISKETQDLIKNSKMENIDDAMDKAYTEIADQLPLTIKERLDNLRFLAMLGNPKTHIRNMVGNTGNRVLTNVKNTVKGGIEDVIGMAWKDYQKNATIGIANKDQRTFAKLDAELLGEAIDDVGNKYNDNPNTEISKRKRHFDNKILNAMSKFNTELLNKEDVWALKGAYRDALQNYMLANSLSSEDLTVLETDSRETKKQKEEALRKAREYASQQAKEATFHQANEVATWLNNLKNSESLPRKNSRTFSRRNSSF